MNNRAVSYAILLALFLGVLVFSCRPAKTFDLRYPVETKLKPDGLEELFDKRWASPTVTHIMRGDTMIARGQFTLRYNPDRTFRCGSHKGTWTIVDKRYIEHRLKSTEQEQEMNFGGLYALTELTDSTLVLTKVLTSNYDMIRILRFRASISHSALTSLGNGPAPGPPRMTNSPRPGRRGRDTKSLEQFYDSFYQPKLELDRKSIILPDSLRRSK